MSKGVGGIDWDVVQDALSAWVAVGTGIDPTHILWEGQIRAGRPPQPGLSLSLTGIEFVGWDWLDTETKVLAVNGTVGGSLAVTGVNTSTGELIVPAHGLVTGDGPLRVSSSGTWPTGLADGVDIWAVVTGPGTVKVAKTFQRAMAPSPSTIALGSAGTGTITLDGTAATVRAGQEIQFFARGLRRATLVIQAYAATGLGLGMPQAALASLVSRCELPSMRDMLDPAGIAVTDFGRIRAHHGSYNLAYFEPRAVLEVSLSLVSEVAEDGTVIERAVVTDQLNGVVKVVPPDQ